MKVVSNSSPLIVLAKLNKLKILKEKFDEIFIPSEVYKEVVIGGRYKERRIRDSKIKTEEVKDRRSVDLLSLLLDRGEAEAIILAEEINADILLMDDKKARKIAKQRGLNIRGTLSLLTEDVKREDLPEIFKELEDVGFRLSNKLKDKIMKSKRNL